MMSLLYILQKRYTFVFSPYFLVSYNVTYVVTIVPDVMWKSIKILIIITIVLYNSYNNITLV